MINCAFTDAELAFLKEFPVDKLRIAGSFMIENASAVTLNVVPKDIDVFLDPDVFPEFLARSKDVSDRFHPVELKRVKAVDLHNYMTWKNLSFTMDANKVIYRANPGYIRDQNVLEFNPDSVVQFNSGNDVIRSMVKLFRAGFRANSETVKQLSIVFGRRKNVLELMELELSAALGRAIFQTLTEANVVIAGGWFRDFASCLPYKDIDVFVHGGSEVSWESVCSELLRLGCTEVPLPGKISPRVNVRKFKNVFGNNIDVMEYGFVQCSEHVVETFDFTVNMLWLDPSTKTVKGSKDRSAEEIIGDIRNRRLIVGKNLWFRASPYRAIRRFQKMTKQHYTIDDENLAVYKRYINEMLPKGKTK